VSVRVFDGVRVLVADADGTPIAGGQDVLELIGTVYYDDVSWVVLPAERLTDDFFSLSTGVAGDIVQKFVNYRLGFAVLGDVTRFTADRTSLADLVRESNRGRHTWFVADLDEFRTKLSELSQPRR
jgi:Domain of unknown function (DUF4180)